MNMDDICIECGKDYALCTCGECQECGKSWYFCTCNYDVDIDFNEGLTNRMDNE